MSAAQRLAEGVLQGAVEGFREVLHRAHRLQRVDDPVFGGDVDADRDLILGQHLLAGHVERLALEVDRLHLHRLADRPEAMHAGLQRLDIGAVDEQQSGLAVHHRMDGHQFGALGLDQPAQQRRLDRGTGRHIHGLDRPRTGIGPHDQLAVGRKHVVERAVAVDHGDLAAAGAEHGEVLGCGLRQLGEQCLLVGRRKDPIADIVTLDLQPVAAIGQKMLAGSEDAEHLALVERHRALVFLHQDALAPQDLFENAHHRPAPAVMFKPLCRSSQVPCVAVLPALHVHPARVIRGLVAPIRGGSTGAGREGAVAGAGARSLPLPAAMRLGRHRGPGRAWVASGLSEPAVARRLRPVRPVFSMPVPGPFG